MKIGIIGTGNMGRTLGLRWAEAGHQVLFGSRDQGKASAVAGGHPGAAAGHFQEAAAFGEVILYTVRGVLPSQLLPDPGVLAGKTVIDCNNRDLGDDQRPAEWRFQAPLAGPSFTERLAADAPRARLVKAFGTIPHRVLEMGREALAPHQISVLLCANDPAARDTVKALVEDLGLVAVDSGGLERCALVDAVADFIRFQIGVMGMGVFTTISINRLTSH
jgi:predicted dinucleotide-binding enzyme